MSSMKKQWRILARTENDLIKQLLMNRGVSHQQSFLKPDYLKLHSPWRLAQMDKLVERLRQAIVQQEPIGVFGDYDHDGTPAAALLTDGIEACGGTVSLTYIPTREEGYSLSQTVINHFADQGIKLLITVDCGITNKKEIDYALSKGIDSMVIDHHVVQEDKYPAAAIVVNPKQKGDTYPFKELCACGLAFKVIQALGEKTGSITTGQMKWYLDLVAISTICDMVPLIDENRVLVHFGLVVLRQTRRLGLKKLMEAAAIDQTSLSSYTVGFGIGPRLNAPGRMEQASIAYDLLVCRDDKAATQLAEKLNRLNRQRQEELDRVFKEADLIVESRQLNRRKVIMVSADGWSDGVVGLVAGRLMDKYHRPSIVLAGRTDGLVKGSARSLGEFHLVEALQLCEPYLLKYGGHAKAAGLTLAREHLELLYDKLIETADQKLSEDSLQPKITIDAILQAKEITLTVVKRLERLEPYGLGNARPLFLIENTRVEECRKIGETKKHLKLKLIVGESQALDAIAFGLAERSAECQPGQHLDLVGMLDINNWQGRQSVQFKAIDWRSAQI